MAGSILRSQLRLYLGKHRNYGDCLVGIHWGQYQCKACSPCPLHFQYCRGLLDASALLPFIGMLDSIMPGAIYLEDVTQQEAVAYLQDSGELNGEPTEDQIAKAKKSIVDRNIPLHLSLFHTLFNLTNICLLIGFTPHLGRLVEKIVQPKVKGGTPSQEAWPRSIMRIRRTSENRRAQPRLGRSRDQPLGGDQPLHV